MRVYLEDRAGAASGNAFCTCPSCGSVVPAKVIDAGIALSALNLGPIASRIIALLGRSVGQWIPTDRIAHHIWGDREDGGPDDPENNIDVHLSRARSAVREAGFVIEGTWHQRRLVRVTTDYKPRRLHPYSLRRKLRREGLI